MKNLRKFGFLILVYNLWGALLFLYAYSTVGNLNLDTRISLPFIEECLSFLSVLSFPIGFLWLLVGSIALIFNKNSGIKVVAGGLILFMVGAVTFAYTVFRSLNDKETMVPLLIWAFLISVPGMILFQKLKNKKFLQGD